MGILERRIYRVELLSPVHIGSGQRLGPADFAVLDGRLWRFDPERLTAALARDPRALDRYIQEGAAALRFWSEADRRPLARYVRPWSGPPPREIREHIADALGRPYLPGSSLKGAIRTALAFAALRAASPAQRQAWLDAVARRAEEARKSGSRAKESADDPLMQALMGKEPHEDALRALRVFDSGPAPSDALDVGRIRVAVHEPSGALSWLQAPGKHVADPGQAFEIVAEILRPHPRAALRVEVEADAFLLRRDVLGPEERRARVREWARACNAFARHIAEGELRFGERLGLTAWAAFYRRLLTQMEAEPQATYLNLGWGGGWRSKAAAEAMGAEAVGRLRRLFNLGKGDPFPKTRRVLFEDGKPTLPLGWIRLIPE
ncbi:MAG: type III-A CRISPR-associated RAMP protein Csm5 [Thermoflexus sp.]|nr:type III-A CRISPR-associated RAMP protein Csm5 [Thermoflexus sp.]